MTALYHVSVLDLHRDGRHLEANVCVNGTTVELTLRVQPGFPLRWGTWGEPTDWCARPDLLPDGELERRAWVAEAIEAVNHASVLWSVPATQEVRS